MRVWVCGVCVKIAIQEQETWNSVTQSSRGSAPRRGSSRIQMMMLLARVKTQSSARGRRETDKKRRGRRQDTDQEQTGEVVKTQTSRHVLVCMYAMWVRMCYCVCGWGAKPDGCVFWSCYESRRKQTEAPCHVCVHVTVPVTQASSAARWDGPHPRGAYPQADQDRDGV